MSALPISKNYIASLIPKGAAILDVGSFDGRDAIELANACQTEVHCFEPYPASFEAIKLQRDPRLTAWPYALASYHGNGWLTVAKGHAQSNTIKQPLIHRKVWPSIKFHNHQIAIKVTTLDLWNEKIRNGAPVDFIWCDVNGAEEHFILGGVQTLAKTKYLYSEFCVKELFDKAMDKERFCKALPGFELIGEFNVGKNFGNLLFKNKNEGLWIS